MKNRCMAVATFALLLAVTPGAWGQDASQHVTWNFSGLVAEGGTWEMTVTTSSREFNPGDGLTLAIDFTINSVGLAYNIDRVSGVYTLVTGLRAFDGEGDMIGRSHAMASTILNGLGLPIEGEPTGLPTDRFGGEGGAFHHPIDSFVVTEPGDLMVDIRAGTIRGTVVHGILLDPGIPPGWYQLRIDLGLEIVEGNIVTLWGVDPARGSTTDDEQTYAVTGPIAIGTTSQPRMAWTLFSSSLPNGGVIAIEDKGYLAASRNLGYSTITILPMADNNGRQIRYLLEPDFPLLWNPFTRNQNTAILDLDYQSGYMEARIENPDGTIVDLGGARFAGRRGMGATTLEDRFVYSFSSYGRHRIELTGWINDTSNQTYVGGGVYEVNVAHAIDIETNVLPGTPFREDGFFDPGFQLFPPVPAAVEIIWELDSHSRGNPDSNTFTAHANRWGYYSPPVVAGRDRFARATRMQFSDPGEYRVSFRATYREEDGTLWMGEKVLTGVVVPTDAGSLINLSSRPPASGAFSITSNARYIPVPADSGDTVIMPVPSSPGLPTVHTFPVGFFLGNQAGFRTDDAALREIETGSAGVLVTPRLASSTGLFPHSYPGDIDRQAYLVNHATRSDSYRFARIAEGSPSAHLPYPIYPWNPGELSADAAGDIYHFWSLMVYRDIPANSTRYGYYSTGVVLSEEITVPRMHETGTALISDGWGTHNLLLHNTAVRPGSIIAEGESFTCGAYFLPLPPESTIDFTITSPDGVAEAFSVTADDSGYAVDMRDRIELDQSGIWQANVVLAQGNESGGILGNNPGDPWEFYVIAGGNDTAIDFHMPPRMPLPEDEDLLVLTGDMREGDVVEGTMYISATFNGAIVEQTRRDIQDGAFVYTVDLAQVSNSFPNCDPFDSNDRLVLTFFTIALTSSGDRRLAAKMIYIQGGILYTGDKDYSPIDPRTREELLEEIVESAETDLAHEIRGRVPVTPE